MRPFTKSEEAKVKQLTDMSVSMTYLEPTQTGLSKSIMDATAIVRSYLKDSNLHDYTYQAKGPESKAALSGYLLADSDIVETTVTLYRPETKNGDPRIWISKLNRFANSNDIISLIAHDGKIFVFNLTQIDLTAELSSRGVFYHIVAEISAKENFVSKELLAKLVELVKRGPVESVVGADTGVGRTLETLLGISMNSSRNPDYKGIELKSFRGATTNRKSLFAQVPDWSLSKFKSSTEILNTFGYTRDGILRLYCTVSSKKANSQGLSLKLDEVEDLLVETSAEAHVGDFAVWRIEQLKKRLLEKHRETFWIKAESFFIKGVEYFSYQSVMHTKKPVDSQLGPLLAQGVITLDHLIKMHSNGKAVEKGPFFKIEHNSVPLLIPNPRYYDLIQLSIES